MIPRTNGLLLSDWDEKKTQSSLTYKVENGRIKGITDGKEALLQAIDFIIRTEKNSFSIYTQNYGTKMRDENIKNEELMKARLNSRIEEALVNDDRISSVHSFSVSTVNGKMLISFSIKSIFGEINYERSI